MRARMVVGVSADASARDDGEGACAPPGSADKSPSFGQRWLAAKLYVGF